MITEFVLFDLRPGTSRVEVVRYFDTPIVVDNALGRTIESDA